jgi:hypothetical protein
MGNWKQIALDIYCFEIASSEYHVHKLKAPTWYAWQVKLSGSKDCDKLWKTLCWLWTYDKKSNKPWRHVFEHKQKSEVPDDGVYSGPKCIGLVKWIKQIKCIKFVLLILDIYIAENILTKIISSKSKFLLLLFDFM